MSKESQDLKGWHLLVFRSNFLIAILDQQVSMSTQQVPVPNTYPVWVQQPFRSTPMLYISCLWPKQFCILVKYICERCYKIVESRQIQTMYYDWGLPARVVTWSTGPMAWLELPVIDNVPWRFCGKPALLAIAVSFSPTSKLLSWTSFTADLGENVVDQDPPFDLAKAITTSACIHH